MLSVIFQHLVTHATAAVLAILAFYLSLVSTSLPLNATQAATRDRAIEILQEKGFEREAFVLRYTVTYRSTDNWLNVLTKSENAYASTNFPFQIVTLYSDFYTKAVDDTERAMVLLHESRHLMGENEHEAYAYAWRNRNRVGWTFRKYSTTESYITIEEQTRENAPEIFNCPDKAWEDCTEITPK